MHPILTFGSLVKKSGYGFWLSQFAPKMISSELDSGPHNQLNCQVLHSAELTDSCLRSHVQCAGTRRFRSCCSVNGTARRWSLLPSCWSGVKHYTPALVYIWVKHVSQ